MTTKLTSANYYSLKANWEYFSVSQYKAFCKCEAAAVAQIRGEYIPETTEALLVGGYVDAYFSGPKEFEEYPAKHPEIFNKNGKLAAKFLHANRMIERVEEDPVLMQYLTGEKQVIVTGEIFGVPWKGKIDVLDPDRIVDLKTVKDFADIYEEGFGKRPWIEYWGYDLQGAIYQELVRQKTGETLPFYIVAVTKEKEPDIKLIEIPQHVMDTAWNVAADRIDRFVRVKYGAEPRRCGCCDWCKRTKKITGPEVYEIKEA